MFQTDLGRLFPIIDDTQLAWSNEAIMHHVHYLLRYNKDVDMLK